MKVHAGIVIMLLMVSHIQSAQPTVLTVKADHPGAPIQPTMWGVFFEDINFGADGGLYAELIKNRSFEFDIPLMGWLQEKTDRFSNNTNSGSAMVIHHGNKRFARISVNNDKSYQLVNEGFFGMGIHLHETYHFSILCRAIKGDIHLRAELIDDNQNILASTTLLPNSNDWKKFTGTLVAGNTFPKARLRLAFEGTGILDIDQVSLFPVDTWKKRSGGLRKDLVQWLYDLQPGFLRFPGGCIVEGRDLSERYQWKKTVGVPDDRELLINRWNKEFKHRPAPDYYQSFGLGFYEYFLLAEDLHAAPLPILSCGLACQFNTAEVVPMEDLDPYIQDALDLIEFANGAVTTPWGKVRADMGHPQPFGMKLIGVGNEQWGPQYLERYVAFSKAIKAKYPDIQIVSGAGPFPDGEMFEYASAELKKLDAEIVDEHYYRAPEWFLKNVTRYDSYDRSGPKIFAGEYAAQSVATGSPENKNNWECALSEAAFMTGLERNADVVHFASYAPLFAHAEGWQWTPDLIWFDNLRSYGTPNYYVQKLFANNRGTNVLPILQGNEKVTGQNGIYASAVWSNSSHEIIIKLVNATGDKVPVQVQLSSARKLSTAVSTTTLRGDLKAVNSFENPEAIRPVDGTTKLTGKVVSLELMPYAVMVAKVKMN